MTYPPRNIGALQRYRLRHEGAEGHSVVVSLCGDTQLPWPHVYVEPDRSCDYSELKRMHVVIATKPGIDCRRTIAEVFHMVEEVSCFHPGYPVLVDVEQQHVAHICFIDPLKVWQIRPGTEGWLPYFG